MFPLAAEAKRQGALDAGWRVSRVNAGYALCATYPSELCVLAAVPDDLLSQAAPFRSKVRVVGA